MERFAHMRPRLFADKRVKVQLFSCFTPTHRDAACSGLFRRLNQPIFLKHKCQMTLHEGNKTQNAGIPVIYHWIYLKTQINTKNFNKNKNPQKQRNPEECPSPIKSYKACDRFNDY